VHKISVIGVALFLTCAMSVVAQGSKPARKRKAVPKAAIAQTEPAPPTAEAPVPPTPEHGPSSPPEVTFQNGELTIVARNSTMGDVLNAVKQKTGAAVEMPGSSTERVVGKFGPGAPRDVMAQLLNGSHYDYVLLGSPENPGALNKVVLMARASGPEPKPQPPQNRQAYQNNENLQAVPDVESEQPPDENVEAPVEAPQEEEQPQPDQQEPQQGAPVVKTPEQLLRELQQQQQQQQQQQEQPPPGAPGTPPQ
jgi:hypothetical protein